MEVLIRYRPSGGRGEFEWTPSATLMDKRLVIRVPQYGVDVPAEITGRRKDGKPRLRKDEPNNREKLHVDTLVTALAKLPEPSRVFQHGKVWPLEEKGYVVDSIWCEVVDEAATETILVPTRLGILGASQAINLTERFSYVAGEIESKYLQHSKLGQAMQAFRAAIKAEINSRQLRRAADLVIDLQTEIFGPSNAGSTTALEELEALPTSDLEEAPIESPVTSAAQSGLTGGAGPTSPAKTEGKEGRLLTRWHAYRERDRALVKGAKALFKAEHGKLFCEACGLDPSTLYGPRGEDRLQAHHRTPIEEMIPGSITKAEDLAMVCPTCHDIIHAKRPWISVEDVRALLEAHGGSTS